jgi:hypothetical protein
VSKRLAPWRLLARSKPLSVKPSQFWLLGAGSTWVRKASSCPLMSVRLTGSLDAHVDGFTAANWSGSSLRKRPSSGS